MRHLLTSMCAGLLFAGCASLPTPSLPEREQVGNFALEARFALRAQIPGQPMQSAGGRLSWEHRGDSDRLLISNPLGYGLARIEMTPARSRLESADGQIRESGDPDALIEEVTGQRLPIRRLPAWLLGRAAPGAQIGHDPLARPSSLREAGWQIDYAYDDDAPGALPARLTLNRDGEIELRLRIEEWKEAP